MGKVLLRPTDLAQRTMDAFSDAITSAKNADVELALAFMDRAKSYYTLSRNSLPFFSENQHQTYLSISELLLSSAENHLNSKRVHDPQWHKAVGCFFESERISMALGNHDPAKYFALKEKIVGDSRYANHPLQH